MTESHDPSEIILI